jgi:hypothetical protein
MRGRHVGPLEQTKVKALGFTLEKTADRAFYQVSDSGTYPGSRVTRVSHALTAG